MKKHILRKAIISLLMLGSVTWVNAESKMETGTYDCVLDGGTKHVKYIFDATKNTWDNIENGKSVLQNPSPSIMKTVGKIEPYNESTQEYELLYTIEMTGMPTIKKSLHFLKIDGDVFTFRSSGTISKYICKKEKS